jgi:putative sigma-54 modulation protein
MQIKVTFRQMEHTESLDELIHHKSEKFGKYLKGNVNVHWTCYVKEGLHYAEIKLLGPTFEYHATGKSGTMYKSLDKVVEKIEKQLHKKKAKWKDHIHHKHEHLPKKELIDEIEKDEEAVIQAQYDDDIENAA